MARKKREKVKDEPLAIFAEIYASKFIKKLENENRRSFSLKEVIDFLPNTHLRDILALHVAGNVIQKLGNGKFQLKFFGKV
jgi:hypothetical protein